MRLGALQARMVLRIAHNEIGLLVIATLAALSMAFEAKAEEASKDLCAGASVVPSVRIEACSAAIAAGAETSEELARWYYQRGNGYYEKRQRREAIADYTRAIELKPNYHQALHNRANLHRALGEYDRAIADYDAAISIW